jgi:hypothetical protein
VNNINPNPGREYRFMDPLKSLLVEIGSHCGQRTLHLLSSSINYLEVGYWMKSRGFHTSRRVSNRRDLFHQIAEKVGAQKVLYLEFGVAKGASMRYWSGLLTNPASSLHGFDTFEGLPEEWRRGDRGAYSAGGFIPEIYDPRVKFFKGLFQDTLPGYVLPEHEYLIINIDCDLYSSTRFVLNLLAAQMTPGTTFIYFDEFSDPHNELRAFNDLLTATNKQFALLGATRSYGQTSFECI